jgi:sialidase-1
MPSNVVLAFASARREASDWAAMSIIMRRSPDGGETWQEPKIIASEQGSAVDNATPIVDRQTGAVHVLYQVNYERCYCMRSDDSGQSFGSAVEITGTFEGFRAEYPWAVLAPGPGHGIQLRSGRLLAPVWLSDGTGKEFGPGKRGHRPSCVSVIYSDDHGHTWQRGDIVAHNSAETPNPSETTAVQLHDGRVMLNIRNESKRFRRLVSYSDNGATGWSQPSYHEGLYEPVCFGSMVRVSEQPVATHNRVLFSNPDSSDNPKIIGGWCRKRENLTAKLSYDEGLTWPVIRVLDPGVAGYSDVATGPDRTMYCLYEGGDTKDDMFSSTHMSVIRFNLDWLSDGKDSLE